MAADPLAAGEARWPVRHDAAALRALLRDQLADPANAWSTGTFGALAEFERDAGEPCTMRETADGFELATARGAMRLTPHPAMRAIAYETLGDHGGWQHGIALCLPRAAARLTARSAITELGPDADAIDPADCAAILVDLGFGCDTAELCVRSGAPEVLAELRAHAGQAPLAEGRPLLARIAAWSPQRVFRTRLARIEVRQPIPPPDGATPPGPHTHVLPQLMREGRTHAATLPIPEGWVPCATLHPPSAIRRGADRTPGLDAAAHARFQDLLARWGEPSRWALKQAALAALDAGATVPWSATALDRHARTTVRVAVRQWRAARTSASLPGWAAELDGA